MTALFSGPPKPQPLPTAPALDPMQIQLRQQAAEDERIKDQQNGKASTIIAGTPPLGGAPNTGTNGSSVVAKTLLGGG